MRHELRAIALMLEALRLEMLSCHCNDPKLAVSLSEETAAAAAKELQYGEQETEAGIREGRNDTSDPA